MPRSPRRSSSPERDRSRRGRSDEGRDCKKDRGDYEDRRRDRDDHRDSRRDRDEHRDRRRDWDDDEDADRKRSREDHTDRKREQSDKGSRVGGNDAKESTISTSRPETKTSHSPDKKYGLVPSQKDDDEEKPLIVKQEPNFNLSGKLAEEQLTVNGIVLKFSQPPEARMPDKLWRLYVFKEDQHVDTLHIHRQPSFLFGRDRGIVDVPIDHPSCSKQHAALVYRPKTSAASGSTTREIRSAFVFLSYLDSDLEQSLKKKKKKRPYLIDLDTTNGTFVNGTNIDKSRYYELKEKDVIKFGNSTREYVLLHNQSA